MKHIATAIMALGLFAVPPFSVADDPDVMAIVDRSSESKTEKNWYTPNFTYWDVSVNYLNWSSGTEQRTIFTDFVYLELEGGAGWNWGEFYFFTDLENPTHDWDDTPTSDKRFVIKPIFDFKLGESNWYFHLQDYFLDSNGFNINNLVPGIAYKHVSDNFWIRPFIGPHFIHTNFNEGFNGWMAGWTFVYDFRISGVKFSLSNWHEFEFGRKKEHYEGGDGNDWGVNGALALWWHPIKEITAGIQYRYALYKLGFAGNSNAIIYSLKYNF